MNPIKEQRKPLWWLYQMAARIMGWVLLSGGIVWFLVFVFWILAARHAAGELAWPESSRNSAYAASTFLLSFVGPGLLALLLAQLIRFMVNAESRPGWLLRHGFWLLYGCAAILAVQIILDMAGWEWPAGPNADTAGLLFHGPSVVPLLAKALICVGFGHALGRILPIIDESRTLV